MAVERGPIVYCFEQVDQPEGVSVLDAELGVAGPFDAVWRPELLDGVVQVEASGTVPAPGSSDQLYAPLGTWRDARRSAARLHAIPYDAWANRGPAAMRVWIPAAQRR